MIEYIGYSWSIGADDAYKRGERPISGWDKKTILDEVAKIDEEKAKLLKKVSLPVLKERLLKFTESHYTSREYNKTKFYALDVEYIKKLKDEDIGFLSTKKVQVSRKFKGSIHYLEWNMLDTFPEPMEKVLKDVTIEERGCFYYVTNDDGELLLKKKKDSRGTWVEEIKEK